MAVSVQTLFRSAFPGLTAFSSTLLADHPEFMQCATTGCGEVAASCGTDGACGEDPCSDSLFGCIDSQSCSKASGDWFGLRPHLQESGVTVDANVAQF